MKKVIKKFILSLSIVLVSGYCLLPPQANIDYEDRSLAGASSSGLIQNSAHCIDSSEKEDIQIYIPYAEVKEEEEDDKLTVFKKSYDRQNFSTNLLLGLTPEYFFGAIRKSLPTYASHSHLISIRDLYIALRVMRI